MQTKRKNFFELLLERGNVDFPDPGSTDLKTRNETLKIILAIPVNMKFNAECLQTSGDSNSVMVCNVISCDKE